MTCSEVPRTLDYNLLEHDKEHKSFTVRKAKIKSSAFTMVLLCENIVYRKHSKINTIA